MINRIICHHFTCVLHDSGGMICFHPEASGQNMNLNQIIINGMQLIIVIIIKNNQTWPKPNRSLFAAFNLQ